MKKILLFSIIAISLLVIVLDQNAQAITPTNGKIAFTSLRDGNLEIYSMNADGTGQTRLTNNAAADVDPSWQQSQVHLHQF